LSYRIEYSPATEQHLRMLTARQRVMVFDGVDEQLEHEPDVETRNRKPMRPNPLAPWELRIGELRVYYEIEEDPERVVTSLSARKLATLCRHNDAAIGVPCGSPSNHTDDTRKVQQGCHDPCAQRTASLYMRRRRRRLPRCIGPVSRYRGITRSSAREAGATITMRNVAR
jgi:mRNA-degrading endonuclease RelE of RelBE toxin-antitoxin system